MDECYCNKNLMKNKLAHQANDLQIYRDKVLKLQDQLIQKNESEKRLLRRHHLKPITSYDLEKQLDLKVSKVRNLEEAYRKQERVIEKMEILLKMQNAAKEKKKDRRLEELEKENEMLRKRLLEAKEDCCPVMPMAQTCSSMCPPMQQTCSHYSSDVPPRGKEARRCTERTQVDKLQDSLELMEKLNEAKTKIEQLERQILENKEAWAGEKSRLLEVLSACNEKSCSDGDGFYPCNKHPCTPDPVELPSMWCHQQQQFQQHHHRHQQQQLQHHHHHHQHNQHHHHHQQHRPDHDHHRQYARATSPQKHHHQHVPPCLQRATPRLNDFTTSSHNNHNDHSNSDDNDFKLLVRQQQPFVDQWGCYE